MLSTLLILGVIGGLVFILVAISRPPVWVKICLLLGFLAMSVVGAIRLERRGLQFDARSYHVEAVRLREALVTGTPYEVDSFFEGKSGWTTTLGYLYYVSGPEPVVGVVFNSAIVVVVSLVTYSTARSLGASVSGSSLSALCFFAPQFFVWGTSLLREPVIWLGIALTVYAFSVAVQNHRNGDSVQLRLVLILVGGLGILYWYRTSIAFVIVVGLVIYSLTSSALPKGLRIGAVASSIVAIPFIAGFVESQNLLDPDRMVDAKVELSSADSGFGSPGDISVASIYLNTPVNFLRTIVGPFPWEIISLGPVSAVEWVFWVVFAMPIAYIIWKRSWGVGVGVVVGFVILLSISISSGNYGGIARMRLMPLVAFMPLLANWWDIARAGRLVAAPRGSA